MHIFNVCACICVYNLYIVYLYGRHVYHSQAFKITKLKKKEFTNRVNKKIFNTFELNKSSMYIVIF